jgi:hypothetical protein
MTSGSFSHFETTGIPGVQTSPYGERRHPVVLGDSGPTLIRALTRGITDEKRLSVG